MAPSSIDFRRVRRRIQRTLNYGCRSTRNLSLPLSEYVVDYFDKRSPFDYMKPATSSAIARGGYADPCTLVIALVYLDRLRLRDQEFFESSNPRDIYLPSLILASKYLYDSDQNERTANSDWAKCVNMKPEKLNQLEWDMVTKMNWNCLVKQDEFERILENLERYVACDFLKKYGFGSYNELQLLSDSIHSSSYWNALFHLMSMLGVATITYMLTLLTLITAPLILQATSSTPCPSGVSFACNDPINNTHFVPITEGSDLSTDFDGIVLDLMLERLDKDGLDGIVQDDHQKTFHSLVLQPLASIRNELEAWLPLKKLYRPFHPFVDQCIADNEFSCLLNPFNISNSFNFGLLMKVS